MTQSAAGSNFNRADLVRRLAELEPVELADARRSFAERLGDWLAVGDAITLFAALKAAPEAAPAAPGPAGAALAQELARLRAQLSAAIGGDNPRSRIKSPALAAATRFDGAADFGPWRRYCNALQREMETAIGPLRGRIRAGLALQSPALKRLATLDAVFERALAVRERELLATLPDRLERRYVQLREDWRAGLGEAADPDDQAAWLRPEGWLSRFRQELREILLAELELRLQPLVGMIEALPGNTESPLKETR